MMDNCLQRPKLRNWLLTFVGKLLDIGYSESVGAVFAIKLKEGKPKCFPDYEVGNIDAEEYVDEQVAALQSGLMEFNFLTYLVANFRLPVHEIVNVFRYAYSNLSQVVVLEQRGASTEAVVRRVQDAGSSKDKVTMVKE